MLRAILALGLVAVATSANLRYDVTQAKAADKASNGAATQSTLKQMQLKQSTPEFKVSAGDTYEDRNGVNFQHPYHMDHAKNCDEEHHHASDSEDHLAELTSECVGRGWCFGLYGEERVCVGVVGRLARALGCSIGGSGWGGEGVGVRELGPWGRRRYSDMRSNAVWGEGWCARVCVGCVWGLAFGHSSLRQGIHTFTHTHTHLPLKSFQYLQYKWSPHTYTVSVSSCLRLSLCQGLHPSI